MTTTVTKVGKNIIMAAEAFFLPNQQDDLVIEIKNSDFEFRFINVFVKPEIDIEEVDVTAITLRRKDDETDTRLLQGGPINITQFGNDARFANGPNLLEGLDILKRDTEVTVTIRNGSLNQGVNVQAALIGEWAKPPTRLADRGELTPQDNGGRRQEVAPGQGPLDGSQRY